MSDRDLILVLGCGRSGTSAITRVLSLCGCALPPSVFGPRDMNPKGFWEPVDATKLNLAFLIKHGSMLADPTLGFEASVQEDDKEEFVGRIRAFLQACPDHSKLVVKCPGVVELFEYWRDAAQRENRAVKVVIPVRHPNEVHASLTAAGITSVELTATFWLTRNLLAERCSRGLPRVVIRYANLLDDWRLEVARVCRALSINLEPDEHAIDGFLTPELYRNRCAESVTDVFAYSWTSRVYELLSSGAEDGPIDFEPLDEIYSAYKTMEQAFRMARREHEKWTDDPEVLLKSLDAMPVWLSGRDF